MIEHQSSFFAVPRAARPTSGGPVDLPILYYDTSYVMALFFADRAAVERLVGDDGVRPALTRGGRAVVALAGYDYRDSTVGPYFEVGLAIPVVPAGARRGERWLQVLRNEENPRRDLGFHVLHLPVTTPAADVAGREIWGLPKFVTGIDVRHVGRDIAVRVDDPAGGEPIMTLDGRAGPGVPSPALPVMLYSRLGGNLLCTTVNGRGRNTAYPGGRLRLRIGDSTHPMAATMRGLGLDGGKPWLVLAADAAQSRLNAGIPVIEPGSRSSMAAAHTLD